MPIFNHDAYENPIEHPNRVSQVLVYSPKFARNIMYRKLAIVIQAATFIGMLVVAVVTWQNESSNELRAEMREGFQAIRAEMRDQFKAIRAEMRDQLKAFRVEMQSEHEAIRNEMRSEHEVIRNDIHDLNGRLGRVEGQLEVLTQERE